MVWLVQNCRSNKCLIPQTPRALPWTRWGRGPQTPRLLTPTLTTNPGSAPDKGAIVMAFAQSVSIF